MRPGHSKVHDGAIDPRVSSAPCGTVGSVQRDAWPGWHPRWRGQPRPYRNSFEMPSCNIGTSKKTLTSVPPVRFQYTQYFQKCKSLRGGESLDVRMTGETVSTSSPRVDRIGSGIRLIRLLPPLLGRNRLGFSMEIGRRIAHPFPLRLGRSKRIETVTESRCG